MKWTVTCYTVAMPNKDFSGLPHTDDERLAAAYAALCAFDGRVPSADALAKLAGVSVEAAGAWLAGHYVSGSSP